jgi:hypothetical protein
MQRYWSIRGYNGTDKIYEKQIKAGIVTEQNLKLLLKTLLAKESLTNDEIVGSYAKNGTSIKNQLLDVRLDATATHYTYSCGSSIWFTAHIVEEE